jgi:hypothetical protein
MILGIAARKINGKEEIRSKGFFVWDLDMFLGTAASE